MSLTSFLGYKDVKERFQEEFQTARFTLNKDLLAPPLSKRYGLVGTAFDYVLRFYVERLNPNAISEKWIAERGVDRLKSGALNNFSYDIDTDTLEMGEPKEMGKAEEIIREAKKVHSTYLSSGRLTKKVLETALLLAQLDLLFRPGIIDKNLGYIQEEDVIDLRNLMSIVNPENFKAKELCLLNPTFGKASKLVGGADADLVIDDMIVEIKTTKKLELRDAFLQLIGYYILHRIAGVGELKPKPKIRKVAVYFSRYSYLHVLNLNQIIKRDQLPDFVRWFKKRASLRKSLAH